MAKFYNVKNEFFAMKGDAEGYIKENELPVESLNEIYLTSRHEIVAFLKAITQGVEGDPELQGVPPMLVDKDIEPFIPTFLKKDQEARRKLMKARDYK